MAKHSLQLEKAILHDLLTDQKTLIKTKELECRDLINLLQGRWYTGRSITEVALAIDSIHREMEEDLRVMLNTFARHIKLMADTQEPQTEINQQLKLVIEYRNLVRNIKVKHINTFKQIEEELQIKHVHKQ